MPYPSPPEISTSYTAQEQALGDGTLPGQELDVDLAAIRASVTAVIEFVKGITRSDGKLANGIVTQEALGAALIIGFDPPSVWATATAYTTRSIVFEGTKIYLCLVPHTASVFATDLASGRWSLLADLTPAGGGLVASNNLSDVADVGNARANLGLGSMATANSGTGASDHRTNLQNDGVFQPVAAGLTSWAAITRASGFDAFVATPSSANLRALLTDESGTGALLFAGSTPSSLVLTNATGLPFAGLAAAAVTTAAEGIASNNVDTQVPTSAAVKAYADALAAPTIIGILTTTGAATVGPWTLPAGVKRFRLSSNESSLLGSTVMLVQLRVAGVAVTTGYDAQCILGTSGNINSTSGMCINIGAATNYWKGFMDFTLHDPATNLWLAQWGGHVTNTATDAIQGSGEVTLSGAVDGVRMFTSAGTFDVSSFNVIY